MKSFRWLFSQRLVFYRPSFQVYANASAPKLNSTMSAVELAMGGCTHPDGCAIRCTRFRPSEDSLIVCGYCLHDISAHAILGVMQDDKFTSLVPVSLPPPPPPPAAEIVPTGPKNTTDEERRGLFKTKPRLSLDLKRKSVTDHPDARRSIGGRMAPSIKNVIPKLIAMNRRDPVPQSEFDHTELNTNYFIDYSLTTAEALTHTLKLNTSNGEDYAKTWYLFTRLSNKSIKPTQYWSKNWPSDRTIASMCQLKYLYVVPDCYDDEKTAFLSSERK